MRKLIAVVAFVATAFTVQPAASPRSETAPIEPVLLNHAQRLTPTPGQRFLSEVHRAYALVLYIEALRTQHDDAVRRLAAAASKAESSAQPEARAVGQRRSGSTARASQPSSGRCGGVLPPCYVMMRESRGSLTAQNPNSTASGKWQFLDSTWRSVTGLPGSASDYSKAQQDAAAAQLWDGGAGCSNWSAC